MADSLADSSNPLLRVENLVRSFGGIKATDNLSLDVAKGELHAIIGPNGAGKTTLISQLTGQLTPNSGAIRADDGVQFALGDIEREIVGGLDAAEAANQVFNAEQGISQRISHG